MTAWLTLERYKERNTLTSKDNRWKEDMNRIKVGKRFFSVLPFSLLSLLSTFAFSCKKRHFNTDATAKTLWPTPDVPEESKVILPSWWKPNTATTFTSLLDEKAFYNSANKNFTPAALAEDWELATLLFALVQAPQEGEGDNTTDENLRLELTKKPSSLLDLVQMLSTKQRALQDWHTGVYLTEDYHRTRVWPVIRTCEGHPDCTDLIGMKIVALPSEVEKRIYAYTAKPNEKRIFKATGEEIPKHIFFKFLNVNDTTPWNVFRDTIRNFPSSKLVSGNYVSFSDNVLLRSTTFRNDEGPLNIEAIDLTMPANKVKLELSYVEPIAQRKADPRLFHHPRGKLFPQRSYGCKELHPNSTFEVGACLGDNSRAFIWLQNFPGELPDPTKPSLVEFVVEFLKTRASDIKGPVVIDLRGNGGGSLSEAQTLACALGGARVAQALVNLSWHRSKWPGKFVLSSGKVFLSENILGMLKPDIDPLWEVRSDIVTAKRRPYQIPPYAFLKQGFATCETAAKNGPEGVKYVLAAGGNEFSATESFLHLMAKVPSRTKIIGTTTMGGTGNPIMVSLPNTGAVLRLSRQRQYDKETGEWIIEGKGVTQDIRWPRDLEQDFERRIIEGYLGDRDLESREYAPLAINKALEITF